MHQERTSEHLLVELLRALELMLLRLIDTTLFTWINKLVLELELVVAELDLLDLEPSGLG